MDSTGPAGRLRHVTSLIPHPPVATYRGDRYRQNFTAGAVLSLLCAAPDGLTLTSITDTLKVQNDDAGIPGGLAGEQWTPPAKKPKPTYETGDEVDDDVPEIEETWPDTLREHCTYFDQAEDRVAATLRQLHFARLVEFTGIDAKITELGTNVVGRLVTAETNLRADSPGLLTPTQQYLVGDARDKTSGSTIPFTVIPFSASRAALLAADGAVDAEAFDPAVDEAISQPGIVLDPSTGDPHLDTELPLRRNLYRRPSYRQYLQIVMNDRNTFVLANMGVTEEHTRLVGTKSATGDAQALAANPSLAELKRIRTLARKIRPFAEIVLAGGPEGVWVAKPLNPKDVHSDVMAFTAASRPGFKLAISEGSSLAWEAFDRNQLTVKDFEEAREALFDGYGAGLVSRESRQEPTTDHTAVAAAAKAETDGKKLTIADAGDYLQRTSDKLLAEIGIDVDVRPVMSSATGLPLTRCKHQNIHTNSETGNQTAYPCHSPAIGGSGYCERHGGTYLSPEETKSLVMASQQKLFAGQGRATEVMIELMLNSTNDAIRLRAAEQILNRTGLNESRDLNINTNGEKPAKSASESVRERILGLAGLTPAAEETVKEQQDTGGITDYGEVIDAEATEEE